MRLSHFAEKILSLVGRHLSPEFSQVLGAQLASGNVKVFVNKMNQNVSLRADSPSASTLNSMSGSGETALGPSSDASNTVISNSSFRTNANDGSPITPGGGRSSPVVRFLIAVLIVLAAMFAIAHFRR